MKKGWVISIGLSDEEFKRQMKRTHLPKLSNPKFNFVNQKLNAQEKEGEGI